MTVAIIELTKGLDCLQALVGSLGMPVGLLARGLGQPGNSEDGFVNFKVVYCFH